MKEKINKKNENKERKIRVRLPKKWRKIERKGEIVKNLKIKQEFKRNRVKRGLEIKKKQKWMRYRNKNVKNPKT